MERDSLSTLQIIVGTVAAGIGAAVAISNFHRGRSRILVESLTAVSGTKKEVQITVSNVGAKDVTLADCGFAVFPVAESPLPWVRRRDRKAAKRYSELGTILNDDGSEQEETVLLKPTERKILKISMPFVAGWLPADTRAWPYARDTGGHDTYAAKAAHVELGVSNDA